MNDVISRPQPSQEQIAPAVGNFAESAVNLEAALDYAKRGLRVIPLSHVNADGSCSCPRRVSCGKPGKHPRINDWQRLATTDIGRIKSWWADWPKANIGIATGAGLLVLDVDPDKGGEASLAALQHEHGDLPPTATCKTGGGGIHYYFRASGKHGNRVSFRPGLDIRADGGQVVAPPSQHASGNRYVWLRSPNDIDVALAPQWLIEAIGVGSSYSTTAEKTTSCQDPVLSRKVQRVARAYLAKLKPAIQGQGGDKQTFQAACYLVIDFNLRPDLAMPVFREWNTTHCIPPWTDDDLMRKLSEADKLSRKRGRLLSQLHHGSGSGSNCPPTNSVEEIRPHGALCLSGSDNPFLCDVPDFVLADWERAKPRAMKPKPGRPEQRTGLPWLILLEVVQQKTRPVIPDVLAAQVIWGGDRSRWPSHWRRHLQTLLFGRAKNGEEKAWQAKYAPKPECSAFCPLHGRRDIPHRHYSPRIKCLGDGGVDVKQAHLGVLEYFGYYDSGKWKYDFRRNGKRPDEVNENLANQLKLGRLWSIYLLAWLFGPACLPPGPLRILQAVTREITRTRRKVDRPDRAEILIGGQAVVTDDGTWHRAAYPCLEEGREYVGFNGNGKGKRRALHGRGYQLETWMKRADYVPRPRRTKASSITLKQAMTAYADLQNRAYGNTVSREMVSEAKAALEVGDHNKVYELAGVPVPISRARPKNDKHLQVCFLEDLSYLCDHLGLIAAGWHPMKRQWLSLADMVELTKVESGRKWLANCRLRLYARASYLTDWRRWFARRLEFSHIPGGVEECQTPTQEDEGAVQSAEQLHLFMRARGLTERKLAGLLGLSRQYVSDMRSGRRRWSKTFEAKLAAVTADIDAGLPVPVT